MSQDSATLFDSRGHRIYDGKIVGPKYEPGLKLPLTLKNVRLVLSEADAAIVPMPLVEALSIQRRYPRRGCTRDSWQPRGVGLAPDVKEN